jgi:hypothetical protein
MAASKRRTGAEWIGGIVAMPFDVVETEGAPRPHGLFWMDGPLVVGHALGEPGELVAAASESLRSTMKRPAEGRPRAPARVRVALPELAAALRAGHPRIEVICAATPELDLLLTAMGVAIHETADVDPSYLGSGIEAEAIAAFFRATAALYRLAPWSVVPSCDTPLAVSIPRFGIDDAALSVIGQSRENYGFLVFSGLDDFDDYLEAAIATQRGAYAELPPLLALNFEPKSKLSPVQRTELSAHRWEVAGPRAYPAIDTLDEGAIARRPQQEEYTIVEAIARALADALRDGERVRKALEGGPALVRTVVVPTHAGEVEVTIRAPHPESVLGGPDGPDLLTALAKLEHQARVNDEAARVPLEEALLRRFEASPEALPPQDVAACRLLLELARMSFNATIATLSARELREALFVVVPRNVSVDASHAAAIVEALRAFYAFLRREFQLEQADACLRVLGGTAAKRLEAALSDPSKFGAGKAFLRAGREAGFDMSTKAGIDAWMRASNGRLPTESVPASTANKTQPKGAKRAMPKGR